MGRDRGGIGWVIKIVRGWTYMRVYTLCVLAYRCLHGSAPPYLAETLHLTSNIEACRRLRSGSTSTLLVPATKRSSLGDRAFPVAAARAWNTLPVSLRTVSSDLTFRRELKTFLFNISFPDNWTPCDIVKWQLFDSDTIILANYYYYYQSRCTAYVRVTV